MKLYLNLACFLSPSLTVYKVRIIILLQISAAIDGLIINMLQTMLVNLYFLKYKYVAVKLLKNKIKLNFLFDKNYSYGSNFLQNFILKLEKVIPVC